MTLDMFILLGALLIWAAIVFALWRGHKWLLYYTTGAFGFILLVLFGSQMTGWDVAIESLEAAQVAAMSRSLGMNIEVLTRTGLAVQNHTGWALFEIGIECSAILETAAFVGLIGFYPAFDPLRKLITIAFGVAATYVLNLLRVLLIVAIVNQMGPSWVFVAHAVFGRVFFFAGVVAMFWYLMTRPTVSLVGRRLEEAGSE